MNPKDILNADVEVVWQWVKQGYHWWIAELASLLPAEWRDRFTATPPLVAEYRGRAFAVTAVANQKQTLPFASQPSNRARLVLPRDMILAREFETPALSVSDVRRMVAHDIDRLTPFRPEQVLFDVALLPGVSQQGRQRAVLGVIPREAARHVLNLAIEQGLDPVEIRAADTGLGADVGALDFMPAARHMTGMAQAGQRNLYWWGAVGGLVAANLVLFVARDMTNLSQLRDAVDVQQASVLVAKRMGSKVEAEAARRAALLNARSQTSPLRALDAATRALPHDSWARRFEWNGSTVRVAGIKNPALNVVAAFEASPAFRNARAATAAPSSIGQAFDVSADAERAK